MGRTLKRILIRNEMFNPLDIELLGNFDSRTFLEALLPFANRSLLRIFCRNVAQIEINCCLVKCRLKCLRANGILRDSIENFDIFSLAFYSAASSYYVDAEKCARLSFSSDPNYHPPQLFFYTDDQRFFLLPPRLGSTEGGRRGWGKREISQADKRVRFIASLILFIDTRIALRLRSQRLRRRNSVAKLGRVKTTPKCCLPAQFHRSRSYISSARVDNTHISQLTLVRYLVIKLCL